MSIAEQTTKSDNEKPLKAEKAHGVTGRGSRSKKSVYTEILRRYFRHEYRGRFECIPTSVYTPTSSESLDGRIVNP